MPLNIPDGFFNVTLIFEAGFGTPVFTTAIGLQQVSGSASPESLGNLVIESYADNVMPSTDNSVTLIGADVFVGAAGPSGSVFVSVPPIAGGGTGSYSPVALAVIARKQTATLGRRGRGRMFLPGTVEEDLVDEGGRLSPGGLSGWNTIVDAFMSQIVLSLEATPVLFHSEAAAPPSEITLMSVAPIVGILRGRIR